MQNATSAVPAPLTRGQSFTLKELAECFMAGYAGGDANLPVRLRYFVERLGDRIAHELDPDEIQDVLDGLARRGRCHNFGGRAKGGNPVSTGQPLAPSTLNRYRGALQAVLSWAKRRRLMPKGWVNPVSETEQLKEDNARLRYLSEEEYDRLLKVAKLSQWPKLHLLIRLGVTTGARKSSMIGLRWRDIDLEAGRAYVERTKNGEPFTLVLMPDIVADLAKIKGNAAPDHLVFCGKRSTPYKPNGFYAAWRTALKDARIEGACFHTLRHTHASWLARQGASLLMIADSMGHKSLTMTRRYSHLCVDSRAEMLNRVFNATA